MRLADNWPEGTKANLVGWPNNNPDWKDGEPVRQRTIECAVGQGRVAGGTMVDTSGEVGGGVLQTSRICSNWSRCDWLPCRDGKWRPVEPGTFPLAMGYPTAWDDCAPTVTPSSRKSRSKRFVPHGVPTVSLLTPDILHDYQKRAVNFQCTSPTRCSGLTWAWVRR